MLWEAATRGRHAGYARRGDARGTTGVPERLAAPNEAFLAVYAARLIDRSPPLARGLEDFDARKSKSGSPSF